MKRRLFKLVVFLLLGAVVNVAVAWACAVWSGSRGGSLIYPSFGSRAESLDLDWLSQNEWTWSHRFYVMRTDPSTAIGVQRVAFLEVYESSTFALEGPLAIRTRAGWPLPSVTGSKWFPSRIRSGSDQAPKRYIRAFPIEVDLTSSTPGLQRSVELAVPMFPIWPGFAIDTIFYAAILWLLTFGPFTARRIIRRRRGHCIKCGYDLRGSSGGEVCPECGVVRGCVQPAPVNEQQEILR